jgi:hypothetical protein
MVIAAFRSSADSNDLFPCLKETCSEFECKEFGIAIATASTKIYQQILGKVFAIYPELEVELDMPI